MAEPALTASLAHCPAEAWQVVAPQLFAQLSSPQPAVRRVVGALLRVLGQAVPVAVLYPAVVEGRIAVDAGDGLAAHPELQVKGMCLHCRSSNPNRSLHTTQAASLLIS